MSTLLISSLQARKIEISNRSANEVSERLVEQLAGQSNELPDNLDRRSGSRIDAKNVDERADATGTSATPQISDAPVINAIFAAATSTLRPMTLISVKLNDPARSRTTPRAININCNLPRNFPN